MVRRALQRHRRGQAVRASVNVLYRLTLPGFESYSHWGFVDGEAVARLWRNGTSYRDHPDVFVHWDTVRGDTLRNRVEMARAIAVAIGVNEVDAAMGMMVGGAGPLVEPDATC